MSRWKYFNVSVNLIKVLFHSEVQNFSYNQACNKDNLEMQILSEFKPSFITKKNIYLLLLTLYHCIAVINYHNIIADKLKLF